MKLERLIVVVLAFLVVSASASVQAAEGSVTIKGWVIDSSCTFTHNLKKPVSEECAVKCAKAGSPLVILTDAGTVYWPISSEMPATGQNDRLMEYAGKRVSVTGRVYAKGGSRAVVIEKIEAEAKK